MCVENQLIQDNFLFLLTAKPTIATNKTLWKRTLRRRGCGLIVNALFPLQQHFPYVQLTAHLLQKRNKQNAQSPHRG